jgi:hypothetical protein
LTGRADDDIADPLALSEGLGVACVPLIGLDGDTREFRIADLRVRNIGQRAWSRMNNNRITDIYTSHYVQSPRYHLVCSLYEGDEAAREAETARALADAGDLVLALRLLRDHDLIAPEHVVPHQRISGGINQRRYPDVSRSHFMVTAFGPPTRIEVYDRFSGNTWIEQLPSLGGSPFTLASADVPDVERLLALVRAYRGSGGSPLLDSALRSFSVGRSRLIDGRQRTVALFCALEALMGRFRKPRARPSLGDLIAVLTQPDAQAARSWGETFERDIRPVRNALAHGDDDYSEEFLEAAWLQVSSALRSCLTLAMSLTSADASVWERIIAFPGKRLPDPPQAHPVLGLRRLAAQAYREDSDALALLSERRVDP